MQPYYTRSRCFASGPARFFSKYDYFRIGIIRGHPVIQLEKCEFVGLSFHVSGS